MSSSLGINLNPRAALPTRELGRTGLKVTTLGYGALELRGMVAGMGRELPPEQPGKILNAVLDAGINYIDAAVDYGQAEEQIGRHLSPSAGRVLPGKQVRLPLGQQRFPARGADQVRGAAAPAT